LVTFTLNPVDVDTGLENVGANAASNMGVTVVGPNSAD